VSNHPIQIPDKLAPLFSEPHLYDVIGAYGGRGSGKTRNFATVLCFKALEFASRNITGVILCCREFMVSLDDSSMQEIKDAIANDPVLTLGFDVGEKYVRTKCRKVRFIFRGMNRNLNSLKSTSRILICWVDEAEAVGENAWLKLIPTLRAEGDDYSSQLWVIWNPENEDSATEMRFRHIKDSRIKTVEINWRDNPWFPAVLERERLRHKENDPATYAHVWEGEYLILSDSQILSGKWDVKEFEPDFTFGNPKFGADFGFSQDPSTLIKCWVKDNVLYISDEAYGVGVELNDYDSFYNRITDSKKGVIYADNSRPETISHIRRMGYSIKSCDKWAGSVQDGIAHLRGYKQIIIHPRCKETIKECRYYSYKINERTGKIMSVIIDKHNHCIDALRYALNDEIKQSQSAYTPMRIKGL